MISRRSNRITRTSKVLDRIAAGIKLRSRVLNLTDDAALFPFDGIEVTSAVQVRTFDELDVSADMLQSPSSLLEIPASAIALRFDTQRIPDDVLVMRSNALGAPSASPGMTFDLLIRSATPISWTADGMNRTPDLLEASFDVQAIPADLMKMRFDR